MTQHLCRSLRDSNINETEIAGQETNRHKLDRDKQRGEERGDTEREDVTLGDVLDGCKWSIRDQKIILIRNKNVIRVMQLRLGQTWEWPGTHSVSRGCPCACLCQSPNGKTALPWSPGRTSARLQTPAPQSPRWKHAACCWGGGGRRGRRGLRCDSTMIYIHIYGSHPSLSRTPDRVCHSAFTSNLCLWTKWNPMPDEWGRVPHWIPPISPSQWCSSGYNLKKGAPRLSVSLTSHWSQCGWHVHTAPRHLSWLGNGPGSDQKPQ